MDRSHLAWQAAGTRSNRHRMSAARRAELTLSTHFGQSRALREPVPHRSRVAASKGMTVPFAAILRFDSTRFFGKFQLAGREWPSLNQRSRIRVTFDTDDGLKKRKAITYLQRYFAV